MHRESIRVLSVASTTTNNRPVALTRESNVLRFISMPPFLVVRSRPGRLIRSTRREAGWPPPSSPPTP